MFKKTALPIILGLGISAIAVPVLADSGGLPIGPASCSGYFGPDANRGFAMNASQLAAQDSHGKTGISAGDALPFGINNCQGTPYFGYMGAWPFGGDNHGDGGGDHRGHVHRAHFHADHHGGGDHHADHHGGRK